MSRSGINYFEVAKAAAQIVGRGKMPTIELVRGLLGTGSNSTIGTHLRAWRAQQNPSQQLALQADLPEELVSLMKGLWDRVTSEANAKIAEIQEAVQNEITVLKQNSQKIQQENNRYQQQNQQHKQEQDGLVQEKSALEQIIISCKTENIELKAKQEGLIQQLQEKQDRIEELNHQNRQIQANLEHYRTASAEQRQVDQQRFEKQQSALEKTIQTLQQDLRQSQQVQGQLKQAKEQLAIENGILESRLYKIELDSEVLTLKLSEEQEAFVKEKSAALQLKTQYEDVYTQWQEQFKRNAEFQAEQAVLLHKIDTLNAALTEVTSKNNVLAHEKWILGQEKAQLFGQLKQIESSLRV